MSPTLLILLNAFFLVFHTGLVVFNCVGWAWRRTRRWHLATLAATAFSWIVMGRIYGTGYCICTDLHWQVRRQMGYHDRAETYIQFLVEQITGVLPNGDLVRLVTGMVFGLTVVLSVALNVRDWRSSPPSVKAQAH
jgi:hypothetical protein